MNRDFQSRVAPEITAEASAWIAQLESGELTAADLDAFREWIGRSPQHAAEIRQLAAMSMEMNVLTNMVEPIQEAAKAHRSLRPHDTGITKALRRITSMAVFACLLVAVIFSFRQLNTSPSPMMITTTVGEYRVAELPDGSLVKLNTDSRVEVSFNDHQRKVRLLAGEAFFDVIPNPKRPFFVYADNKQVKVVGTAFLVRLIDQEFELMVTKGKVELAKTATIATVQPTLTVEQSYTTPPVNSNKNKTNSATTDPIALVAGQSITMDVEDDQAPIVAVSEREQLRELSWQEGLHDFSNTSLEDVVEELSRHSTMTIEITDPALRDLKFGGIFRIGDTEALFGALETPFGIQISYIDKNKVSLSRQE